MAKPQEQQRPTNQESDDAVMYHCEKCGHMQEGQTLQSGGKAPTCCGEEMKPTTLRESEATHK